MLLLFRHPETEGKTCGIRKVFVKTFQCLRGKRMFVTSQTLVVYAPSVQWLNRECSSWPWSQMQSDWEFSMYGSRTVVFRRYMVRRVCRFLHPLHWFNLVNRLSSVTSTVSMTILVVLSILSLSCVVDDLRSCRRRVGLSWTQSLRGSKLSSTDVHTSLLKEYSLDSFVRSAVRRDLVHNLWDWGLSSFLVCFVSLLDNCQVVEVH